MDNKILTIHPQGKNGVKIDRNKYNIVRAAILEVLSSVEETTFTALMADVEVPLNGKFDGSIGWYTTTVKLDLETRGEIERVPGSKPQRIRLA